MLKTDNGYMSNKTLLQQFNPYANMTKLNSNARKLTKITSKISKTENSQTTHDCDSM